jgi:hypothetical protein
MKNHPSTEWIDWEKHEVFEDYNLELDIRFKGLKSRDAEDHEKCLRWELARTRIFKEEKYENDMPRIQRNRAIHA